ncbi:MAG: ATP-NAD kinase family protein [Candidatus Hadarchaeales archaeon]
MRKIGFVVNPIAGMGGRVGLKGTDGPEALRRAVELGAEPVSHKRGLEAMKRLTRMRDQVQVITYPGEMGETVVRESGCEPTVIGSIKPGQTTAEDTKLAVKKMIEMGVDLVMFVGGDGTARDVYEVAGSKVPILGVPSGVKIYSAVFANTPSAAGDVASLFLSRGLPVREAEVMDIDEDTYRRDELAVSLKGYAVVPYEPVMMQTGKESSSGFETADQKAIARWMVELMEKGRVYILGPGTTTRAVAEELGIYDSTLLGVDLILDYKLVGKDVNENQIMEKIEKNPAAIVVSPLGRQGFIFGRGNQQISPRVIKKVGKKNIIVLATPQKLSLTPVLKVDTGDPGLDSELRGYIPVISGYFQTHMVRIA